MAEQALGRQHCVGAVGPSSPHHLAHLEFGHAVAHRIDVSDLGVAPGADRIAEGDLARHERLDTRPRAWNGAALRLLDALGATPAARARLAKAAAQGAASAATVETLLARGRERRLGRTADEPA